MSQARGAAATEDRRARRRALFLDAADEAIRTLGPSATMADVAAAAGVTKPVLYRFISDKEDLAAALAARYAQQLDDLLAAGTSSASGPRAMLYRTISAYLAFIETEPRIYEFLVQRAPTESPDAAEHLTRFTHQLAERVTGVVTEELRRFGRRTDGAEAFAHGMIGMVQSVGDWWMARRATQPSPTRDELASQLALVLWTGLAGLPEATDGADGPAALG